MLVNSSIRSMHFETECLMAVQDHTRSLILGTNGKRVCNFLSVIDVNLGPFLSRFRDIADFLLKPATFPYPTLFHLKFGDTDSEIRRLSY